MQILIVEDSPTDREILRYLLEAQFKGSVDFHEASTLAEALGIIGRVALDCIVLDLQLPDSTGADTFKAIDQHDPDVPVIVMTHNKDRDLALQMIRDGAADYVLKSYTDEEDTFRRIVFAIEKHRHSIRVPPDEAASYRRVSSARNKLIQAQKDDLSSSAIRDMTVETTSAVADLSHKMYTELQKLNVGLVKQRTQQKGLMDLVNNLDRELLRGYSGRPSMRSQVDLLDHRVGTVEGKVKTIEDDVDGVEDTQRREALKLTEAKMSNKTKIILAIVSLLGLIVTSATTYLVTQYKASEASKVTPSTTGNK